MHAQRETAFTDSWLLVHSVFTLPYYNDSPDWVIPTGYLILPPGAIGGKTAVSFSLQA